MTTTISPEVHGTQEVHRKSLKISKMESFEATVKDFWPLTIVAKLSILDAYDVSRYALRFIYMKRIIKYPFNSSFIPEKCPTTIIWLA